MLFKPKVTSASFFFQTQTCDGPIKNKRLVHSTNLTHPPNHAVQDYYPQNLGLFECNTKEKWVCSQMNGFYAKLWLHRTSHPLKPGKRYYDSLLNNNNSIEGTEQVWHSMIIASITSHEWCRPLLPPSSGTFLIGWAVMAWRARSPKDLGPIS